MAAPRPTPHARRRTAAAALATLGLVAAGCGVAEAPSGSRDAAGARDDTTGPTTPTNTPESDTESDTESGPESDTELPPLARAEQPWQVARQIEATESLVRDGDPDADDLARAGTLQQLAYRTLAERPRWDDRVRELVAPRLREDVRDNVAARREMLRMQRSYAPHDELPAWRVVAPEPAQDLRAAYREAEQEFGVDWEYLASINLVETGMGRIRGDSVAGAQGPMQFIPETWERYGEGDVTDTRDAIMAAGRYLAARGFESDDDEAIDDAVYSYNNHPAYVRAIRLHAEVMKRDPRAFLGYHAWDVVFSTRRGDVTLPVGYDTDQQIPVDRWLADRPQP